MMPSVVGAGPIAVAESGNIQPELPAGSLPDDIGIMAVMTNASNALPSLSPDWADLGVALQAAGMSAKFYWRRFTGTDDQPDPFTIVSGTALSATNGLFGRIWGFADCVTTGDPFEDLTENGSPTNSTTPTALTIDTTGPDRLAVAFAMIDDDTAWTTAPPPADWSLAGTDASSGLGGDARMVALQRAMVSAGNVPQVVFGTLSLTENWRTLHLALIGSSVVPAEGQVAAALNLQAALTGDRASAGSLAAALNLQAALTGNRASAGALAGALNLQAALTGARPSAGALATVLDLAPALTGARSSLGSLAAGLNLAPALTGARTSLGSLAAGITLSVALTGSDGQADRDVRPYPFPPGPVSGFPWPPRPVKSFQEVAG